MSVGLFRLIHVFDDLGMVVDRGLVSLRRFCQSQAALLADVLAIAEVTPEAEFAAFEIASALKWTRQFAATQLDLAYAVMHRLPALHAAMSAGDLELAKVRVIVDGVLGLDLDLARSIVAVILPDAPGLTTGELGPRLAKLVLQADPDAAAKRHQKKVRDRRVELQPEPDGCATLLGLNLPAEEALAASNRIAAMAQAIKQAGDPRSLDQIRADTFLDLLMGRTGHPRDGGVEIVSTLETLARLANQPGHLNGYGPVIADIARQVAEQQRRSPWTFTIRDEASGEVFTGATRRRPTEAMARNVRARDRTCRAPGCRRPATHADIDHTIPHSRGGLTIPRNLGVLCRYHHRAKHEGWWLLVQATPGVFVWRSPLGRRYTVHPAAP